MPVVITVSLELPYYANCRIAGKSHTKLPIIKMNDKTIVVRLPDGQCIKRHLDKHPVDIVFVDATR